MLEHTLETVTNLVSVVVEYEPPCDPGDEPGVTIRASRHGPDPSSNEVWMDWIRWMIGSFGPDVARWFQMIPQPAG